MSDPTQPTTAIADVDKIVDYVWAQATLNANDSMSERRELAGDVCPKAKRKLKKILATITEEAYQKGRLDENKARAEARITLKKGSKDA